MATWTQTALQTTYTAAATTTPEAVETIAIPTLTIDERCVDNPTETVPTVSHSATQTTGAVVSAAPPLSVTYPNQDRWTGQNRQTVLDQLGLDFGISIPGVFLPVDVVVRDPDGNRLPQVKWIMSAGVFPTAARVDANAEATMRLLGTTYTEFMAVAEDDTSETEFLDYAWYTGAQDQEPVAPLSQDSAEIVITPERVEMEGGPTGLSAGSGVNFG